MTPDNPGPPPDDPDSQSAASLGTEADPDLVEYLLIVVPEIGSFAALAPVLVDLVDSAAIRILDLVFVERSATDGRLSILEIEDLGLNAALSTVDGDVGGMLSEHDIGSAAVALEAGMSAMLLLVEDRWAEKLSVAATQAGGRVVGGERVSRRRLEAALRSQNSEQVSSAPRVGR